MTVHEIERQIETELATFNLSLYFGSLPKDFLINFKKCLIEVAPASHQIRVKVLKEIIKKKETELTFMEVGMCVNVIQSAPLHILSEDLDSAIIKLEKVEAVRIAWNDARGRKEQELIQKKQNLIKLAGAGGGNGQVAKMIVN